MHKLFKATFINKQQTSNFISDTVFWFSVKTKNDYCKTFPNSQSILFSRCLTYSKPTPMLGKELKKCLRIRYKNAILFYGKAFWKSKSIAKYSIRIALKKIFSWWHLNCSPGPYLHETRFSFFWLPKRTLQTSKNIFWCFKRQFQNLF